MCCSILLLTVGQSKNSKSPREDLTDLQQLNLPPAIWVRAQIQWNTRTSSSSWHCSSQWVYEMWLGPKENKHRWTKTNNETHSHSLTVTGVPLLDHREELKQHKTSERNTGSIHRSQDSILNMFEHHSWMCESVFRNWNYSHHNP